MFMDIDFDEQPSDLAATSVRAGAKFKPKARPRLRKHVSVSTSRTISNDTNEIDEDIHASTKSIQPEEEGGRVDLESVRIVEEVTCAYGHHTEKFQPKPRFHNNVIQGQNYGVNEEPSEPHYFADDISHISTDSSCPTVNEEPRNESFNTNVDSYAAQQEEKFPQVPQGTVPEMATGNSPRGWEHEERVKSPCNDTVVGEDSCFGNTVEEQTGKRATSEKSRAAQKRQKNSKEPNQCSKQPQKKKKKKRTLEKELLEIPDDEIRSLPIRDLLRLVDYKEWVEKKESNRGKVSQSQESTSKASDNQYSQDDTENFESDEYRENQESSRVKPDSPVNYQTYSHKTARSHWSKQDTELFYEGICEFGSNFSMVQQLFPNRSRQQLKLKYKLEERKHPLKLNDALTSRSKHHIHYQNVIKKFQQEAAARKAEQEEEEEDEAETRGEGGTEAEAETNDVPENEKYEETEKAGDAQVEDENSLRLDEAEDEYDQLSNGGDDDEAECDYWASYKSRM